PADHPGLSLCGGVVRDLFREISMMEAGLRRLLEQADGKRVLVVGDLYLDHYIFGSPNGISREAPVMVLDEQRREDQLGGGAAPALALRKLGYEVSIAGVVGDDPEGQR